MGGGGGDKFEKLVAKQLGAQPPEKVYQVKEVFKGGMKRNELLSKRIGKRVNNLFTEVIPGNYGRLLTLVSILIKLNPLFLILKIFKTLEEAVPFLDSYDGDMEHISVNGDKWGLKDNVYIYYFSDDYYILVTENIFDNSYDIVVFVAMDEGKWWEFVKWTDKFEYSNEDLNEVIRTSDLGIKIIFNIDRVPGGPAPSCFATI